MNVDARNHLVDENFSLATLVGVGIVADSAATASFAVLVVSFGMAQIGFLEVAVSEVASVFSSCCRHWRWDLHY